MSRGRFLEPILGDDPRRMARRLTLCVLVGLVAGVGAVAFSHMLELIRRYVEMRLQRGRHGSAARTAALEP